MLLKLHAFEGRDLRWERMQVDSFIQTLEGKQDYEQVVAHIDMDAFYASVEIRDNPTLKDKPIAVGTHIMLSTANYEARKFGVRSGMPVYIAKKLCSHLTIVRHNPEKYKIANASIREVIKV